MKRLFPRLLPLLLLSAALLALPACKKSVEGETKRFARHTERVQALSAVYPGFKAALQAQLDQANKAMEAAKAVVDKEQSAKQMAEVNTGLSRGLLGKLDSVDARVKTVRDKIVKASTAARDKNDRLATRNAARNARDVLARVEGLLRKGAGDLAGATAVVSSADSDLRSAERGLDQAIKSAKNKQKSKSDKKHAKDKAKAGKGGGAGGSAPAAADWTCSYCDKKNKASATKCDNCGAARE